MMCFDEAVMPRPDVSWRSIADPSGQAALADGIASTA
jgi:hypothetical protein